MATIVLAPTLFVGFVEAALWAVGFGTPSNYFVSTTVDGQQQVHSNRWFAKKYFGAKLNRPSVPFSLAVRKQPGVFRIFVLGGSAARGFPQPAFGMARQLEVMLESSYPEAKFEVINAAVTAINSHVVREIAKDCAQLEPDLFVVYLGNNEVVGPFGPGTVFEPLATSRTAMHASLAVRSTRIGQLAGDLMQLLPQSENQSGDWRGMEMFLGNHVPLSDPRLETMYRHFMENLEDICAAGRAGGAQTLLCTLGVNEKDCPPFGSAHREGLSEVAQQQWAQHFERGCQLQQDGDWAQAADQFRVAAEIDDQFAELAFRLANCDWQLGDHDRAAAEYAHARDLDTLRFRADQRINDIVRAVAHQQTGVHLVNAEAALRGRCDHGIADRSTFYEHVHLRFAGNYTVAVSLWEKIRDRLPARIRECEADQPVLSLFACQSRLAFSTLEKHEAIETILKVTGRPPFTSHAHKLEHNRLQEESLNLARDFSEDRLAKALHFHEAALQGIEPHWMLHDRYANVLFHYARDLRRAEHHWRKAHQVVPHSHDVNHHLAVVLAAQNRPLEATPFFEKALASAPKSPSVLLNYARLLGAQGEFARAEACLRTAEQLRPDDSAPLIAWADLQVRQGLYDLAIQSYLRASQRNPGDLQVHLAAADLLKATGKKDDSIACYRKALQTASDQGLAGHVDRIQQQLDEVLAN